MRLGYHVTSHGVLVFEEPIELMQVELKNGQPSRLLIVTAEGVVAVPLPLPPTALRPRLLTWSGPPHDPNTWSNP